MKEDFSDRPAMERMAPALFHAASSLTAGDVDVWRLDLSALQRHEAALLGLLQRHERDLSGHRGMARAALRLLLGAYLECLPEKIRPRAGTHGKPKLDGRQGNRRDIRFNLSHSDSMALAAISLRREVGIDVERLRKIPACIKIARRYFSADDCERLEAASQKKRNEVFLRLWSRHEAIAKTLGVGVHRLGSKRKKVKNIEVQDISWREPDGVFYPAALGVAGSISRLRRWSLT